MSILESFNYMHQDCRNKIFKSIPNVKNGLLYLVVIRADLNFSVSHRSCEAILPSLDKTKKFQIVCELLQNPQLLNSILQEIQRIRPQEYEAIMVGFNNQSNPQQSLQRFAALMADTEV